MDIILDLSPKKIWLGLTIPGKKMMKLLEGSGGNLLEIYGEEADSAIAYAALAINKIPTHGAEFGPRAADLRKSIQPYMFYGAIITDIRDFLKLRFRVEGFTLSSLEDLGVDVRELQAGRLMKSSKVQDLEDSLPPILHFVIAYLDDLSSNPERNTEQIEECLITIRGLLVEAYGMLRPGSSEFLNSLFKEGD